MRSTQRTMVGMFLENADARRAVHDLEEAGFPMDRISVAMRERYDSAFAKGMSGTLLSLAVGNQASITPTDYGKTGVKGLAPATEEESPGFGPIIAAGLLAQGLGGAALGMAAGGLTGALSDIGISNDVAQDIIDRVRAGKETMVCIQMPREDSDRIEKIFLDNRANTVYRGTNKASDFTSGHRSAQAAQKGF